VKQLLGTGDNKKEQLRMLIQHNKRKQL